MVGERGERYQLYAGRVRRGPEERGWKEVAYVAGIRERRGEEAGEKVPLLTPAR